MQEDAKKHASEDKKRREKADSINRADQLVYQTEKNLKDLGDKIDSESKNKLEAAVGRLKEVIKSENVEEIQSASEALSAVWNDISSKIYQQSAADGAQPQDSQPQQQSDDENVQEAEFEVVDNDKDKK